MEFFPVHKANVYEKSETGKYERVPRKKALINSDACMVLSVVSDRYQVLEIRTVLELAKICCMKALPYVASPNGVCSVLKHHLRFVTVELISNTKAS